MHVVERSRGKLVGVGTWWVLLGREGITTENRGHVPGARREYHLCRVAGNTV